MANVIVDDESLKAIGNSIRGKNGTSVLYTPAEMPGAIDAIKTGGGPELTESDLVITGNPGTWAKQKYNLWLLDNYGDKISTNELSTCRDMLLGLQDTTIPFNINISKQCRDFGGLFANCSKINTLPKICGPDNGQISLNSYDDLVLSSMFSNCSALEEIPDDFFNFINLENRNKTIAYECLGMFDNCKKLKKLPNLFPIFSSTAGITGPYSLINGCEMLKDVDLPMPHSANSPDMTSEILHLGDSDLPRVRNYTFDRNGNYPADESDYGFLPWEQAEIDLHLNIGFGKPTDVADPEFEIKDSESYYNLKDNPNAWTADPNWSFYNKASAMATLQSLPDQSQNFYGKPTIYFKEGAGSLTDEGGISSSDSEITELATAKGYDIEFI